MVYCLIVVRLLRTPEDPGDGETGTGWSKSGAEGDVCIWGAVLSELPSSPGESAVSAVATTAAARAVRSALSCFRESVTRRQVVRILTAVASPLVVASHRSSPTLVHVSIKNAVCESAATALLLSQVSSKRSVGSS